MLLKQQQQQFRPSDEAVEGEHGEHVVGPRAVAAPMNAAELITLAHDSLSPQKKSAGKVKEKKYIIR